MDSFRTPRRFSVLIALSIATMAQAQIRYVDDDAPVLPTPNGLAWSTAYTSLQAALADAAASGGSVTEIRVAQGTYKPAGPGGPVSSSFVLLNGVSVLGGYAGIGAPNPDFRDPANQISVLSADLNNDDVGFLNRADN